MKKMIGFFLIIALLIGASVLNGVNNEIISSYNKIAIVSSNYVEDYKDSAIESGGKYFYFFDNESLIDYEKFGNIEGLNFYFDKNTPFSFFEDNVDFIYKSDGKVNGYDIYYGYTVKYKDFLNINNKKVNFQLVKTQNEWIMGFPLILTGF